jgi:hypothetical protein
MMQQAQGVSKRILPQVPQVPPLLSATGQRMCVAVTGP